MDVRDTARLHIAGLIDPEVRNECLFAFAEPYSWKKVLGLLKEIRPNHTWPAEVRDQGEDLAVVQDRPKMEDILLRNFGVQGFTGLRDMLRAAIDQADPA